MKIVNLLKNQTIITITGFSMIFLFIFSPLVALSAETQMTGTQLKQLLDSGKTLILGGEGEGYTGELEFIS